MISAAIDCGVIDKIAVITAVQDNLESLDFGSKNKDLRRFSPFFKTRFILLSK